MHHNQKINQSKHVLNMLILIMILLIMMLDMQLALVYLSYFVNISTDINVLIALHRNNVTIVNLWCIIRLTNWIHLYYQHARKYLYSMYYTCTTIILSDNKLNNMYLLDELLRNSSRELMTDLYAMLNGKHQSASDANIKFFNLDTFFMKPAGKIKTGNFEYYLKKRSLMLLTTIVQKIKKCHSKIRTLAYPSKFVSYAQKSTWLCLSRAVYRSNLVLKSWIFKCVSPYFRQKSKYFVEDTQKMDFCTKYIAKTLKFFSPGLNICNSPSNGKTRKHMIVCNEKILMKTLLKNNTVTFIMIMKYVIPNG